MSTARRALLLALDNYTHPRLAKLLAPRNDVLRLREKLLDLGYADAAIGVHVSSRDGSLSTAALRTRIRTFIKSAKEGEELLLYLSGHGIDHDGSRLVVPFDFDLEDPLGADQLLSDHWVYGLARDAAADAFVVIADTCRSGAELALQPARLSKGVAEEEAIPFVAPTSADAPTIAMLYSCGRGRKSFATEGRQGESYFTRALCGVLGADQQAYTLGEILDAVTRELGKAEPQGRQEPFLDERFTVAGRLGDPAGLVIKESEAARLRQRIARSPWCRMLAATSYWPRGTAVSPGLALQLQVVAVRAEAMVAEAARHLPQDRWHSASALGRLFDGLRHLVGDAPIDAPIAAQLLAAPMVHEAILAGLVLRLATAGAVLDPRHADGDTTAGALASRAWRQALDSDDDLDRRRAHLRLAGAPETADDLLVWQLWSFAYGAGELWAYAPHKPPGASGWLNDMLDDLLRPAPMPEVASDGRVMQLFEPRRLVRLARLLFVEPEDIDSDASRELGGLARRVQIGSGTELWRFDEVEVAHLLSLAATLALDARRLPVLVADQLGQGDGFNLLALQRDLAQAAWQRSDATLTLQLQTAFPATHAVLGALVALAERHRQRLSLGGRIGASMAARLPEAILDTGLEPETDEDNRPRFDVPHVHFTLDQHRVLRLLLGERLYADPVLALRELYQNAMDACRYRRARAALVARAKGKPPSYVERIEFGAGRRDGRSFIACRDNGIGMSSRHLRDLFARAGRRFTDAHEFHLDYAQWQEAEIPFWSNSRFGIGVLSYFMLADEIVIETRRVETDGLARPDDGIEVRITGSRAMFRIRRDRAVLDGEGGTRVTLFLKDPAADPDQMLKSIQNWLWLPEVETTIHPSGWSGESNATVLHAGIPTTACVREHGGVLLPVPGTQGTLDQPRLFWAPFRADVDLEPIVLVDGIRTSIDRSQSDHMHRVLLANLTEDLAGEVGVDRSQVRPPATLRTWIRNALDTDRGHALLASPACPAERLAALALARPQPLEQLDADLRSGQIAAEGAPKLRVFGQAVSIGGIGLSIADEVLQRPGDRENEVLSEKVVDLHMIPRLLFPFVADRLVALHTAGIVLPQSLEELASYLVACGAIQALPLTSQWLVQCVVSPDAARKLAPPVWARGTRYGRMTTTLERLRLGHMVGATMAYGYSYAELAERTVPLLSWGAVGFDSAALAALDELPSETKSYLEDLFTRKRIEDLVEESIGWSDLCDARTRSADDLMRRVRLVRPLAKLGFVSATHMEELERLVLKLSEVEALGLSLSGQYSDFDLRLLLRDRVTALQLGPAWSSLSRQLSTDAIRSTFQSLVDASLLACAPALIARLELLSPAAAELIAAFGDQDDEKAPSQFALLQTMLKQGCDAADVPALLAALHGVELIPSDLDVAKFGEALYSVQRQPELVKLIAEVDDHLMDGTSAPTLTSVLLPVACIVVLGFSADAIVQVLNPLRHAGIIDADLEAMSRIPNFSQVLPILMGMSELEESRWTSGIDASALRFISVSQQMPPTRLAQVAAPLSVLGLLSVDLDEFARCASPHRYAAKLMSRDGDGAKPWRVSLNAFELAAAAHDWKTPVRDLAGALDDLDGCGVDVAEARRFADWLAANPPRAQASPLA